MAKLSKLLVCNNRDAESQRRGEDALNLAALQRYGSTRAAVGEKGIEMAKAIDIAEQINSLAETLKELEVDAESKEMVSQTVQSSLQNVRVSMKHHGRDASVRHTLEQASTYLQQCKTDSKDTGVQLQFYNETNPSPDKLVDSEETPSETPKRSNVSEAIPPPVTCTSTSSLLATIGDAAAFPFSKGGPGRSRTPSPTKRPQSRDVAREGRDETTTQQQQPLDKNVPTAKGDENVNSRLAPPSTNFPLNANESSSSSSISRMPGLASTSSDGSGSSKSSSNVFNRFRRKSPGRPVIAESNLVSNPYQLRRTHSVSKAQLEVSVLGNLSRWDDRDEDATDNNHKPHNNLQRQPSAGRLYHRLRNNITPGRKRSTTPGRKPRSVTPSRLLASAERLRSTLTPHRRRAKTPIRQHQQQSLDDTTTNPSPTHPTPDDHAKTRTLPSCMSHLPSHSSDLSDDNGNFTYKTVKNNTEKGFEIYMKQQHPKQLQPNEPRSTQVADKLRVSISQKLRQQQQEIRDIQQDLEICNFLLAKRDQGSDETLLNLLDHSIPSPRKQSRRTAAEAESRLGFF